MLLEEKTIISNIKKGIKESFISIFLIILFAIVLLQNPENFMNVAISIFGYGAIFIGVLNLVLYFKLSKEQRFLNNKLKTSVLLISFGIVAFFENSLLKEMITILLGGYLLFMSSSRLELSMKLQNYTKKLWLYSGVFSLINIIIALILIINPFAATFKLNQFISILLIVTQVIFFLQNVCILIGVKTNEQENK